MENDLDVTSGSIIKIFIKYAIPTILGMVAISSASIVDGIFVGRFIGSNALAVINLIVPYVSLLLGVITMLGSGGCVLCGKLMGEKKSEDASRTFSKFLQMMFILILIPWVIVLMFPYQVAYLLGADNSIADNTVSYLINYTYFLPFQLMGIGLSFFSRVNGRPGLTSFALLFSAVMNVFLDFIFVVLFGFGIRGAAFATGISQSMTFFILLPTFFNKNSALKLIKPVKFSKDILFSIFNGISEFLNETSSGIVAFVFNHVLMSQSGVDGVAAFTTINFFLYSGCLVSYGVVASMNGPISINFGAQKTKRVNGFLKVSILFNLIMGACIAAALYFFDDLWVSIFLKNKAAHISQLAVTYIRLLWPAFLISGLNIVITGYFTSTLKPGLSFIISALRSLLFPILFILVLNSIFMDEKVFLSIPIAELLTLLLCILCFFIKIRKKEKQIFR